MTTRFAVRRDKNALALFDRSTGAKIRLTSGTYSKSKHPELVDMKITDHCLFACTWCYQGSTPEGKHATHENLLWTLDELQKAGVFEIAYGGGETTSYPQFIDLLKETHARGIVANFTTRSLSWVRKNWKEIEPYVGAFAYSADNIKFLDMAARMFKDIPNDKINIHYVMGLGDKQHFAGFLKRAHEHGFRVTLLGYKTTGRGKNVIPHPYDWWVEVVSVLARMGVCPTLSIDTPLAEQYDGKMPVSKKTYHTREGFVSAYIDAVAMSMGASSFDEAATLVPFDKEWVQRYAAL